MGLKIENIFITNYLILVNVRKSWTFSFRHRCACCDVFWQHMRCDENFTVCPFSFFTVLQRVNKSVCRGLCRLTAKKESWGRLLVFCCETLFKSLTSWLSSSKRWNGSFQRTCMRDAQTFCVDNSFDSQHLVCICECCSYKARRGEAGL